MGIDVALADPSVKEDKFGDTVLFTGNRHAAKDFLFRAELHEYVRNGTLSQLYTAFSRDQVREAVAGCFACLLCFFVWLRVYAILCV